MDEDKQQQNATLEEIKKVKKVYKKLLPGWDRNNGTLIARKIVESAIMAKMSLR